MDVNGYALRIREAREQMATQKGVPFIRVEEISLSALQSAFKTHASWSDMQNTSSAFVNFLKDSAPCDGHDENDEED